MACEIPLIEDDKDLLPILRASTDAELGDLVELIVKKGRLSEQLSSTSKYRAFSPEGKHSQYYEEIAAEIQKFGGNTIVSAVLRSGRGVRYIEIVADVASKVEADVAGASTAEDFETAILMKVLGIAWELMDEAQKAELMRQLGIAWDQMDEAQKAELMRQLQPGMPFSKSAFAVAAQTAFRAGGFLSYQLSVIAANAVMTAVIGRGLSFAANAVLTRTLGLLAGPIGWGVTSVWFALGIAGPAFRVTLPAVFYIASLRRRFKLEKPGVLFCGRSGHGKSSVINRIAGAEIATVGFERATTPEAIAYRVDYRSTLTLKLVDTRGVFESTTPEGAPSDDAIAELRRALIRNGSSLIAHTIAAPETRAMERDLTVLSSALEEMRDALALQPRLLALLTKADTLGNPRKWPSEENLRSLGTVVNYFGCEALGGVVSPIFSGQPWKGIRIQGGRLPYLDVVPVCALKDEDWNLETLMLVVRETLLPDGGSSLAQVEQTWCAFE